MKSYALILVLFLFGVRALPQGSNWSRAAKWTMYAVHGRNIWELSVDSLGVFNHISMNDDSLTLLLAGTTRLSTDKAPVWMGGYVTTCVLNNSKRKVLISSYGGFFFDAQEKSYYQIPAERQKAWLDYLTELAAAAESK
jgi:hypothetical protein